jgi:hypothetical protein
MRTAGVETEDAAELAEDPESRAWFEKLAGREGTLAYLPARFGRPPVWMAVSHLGGHSQKLRWQLSVVFRVPGFRAAEGVSRPVGLAGARDRSRLPASIWSWRFGEGV